MSDARPPLSALHKGRRRRPVLVLPSLLLACSAGSAKENPVPASPTELHQRPDPTPVPDPIRPPTLSAVFGQDSMTETQYNEVRGDGIFHPGGIHIDKMPAPTPSRVYIYDSGNHRILGLRSFGRCEGGPRHGARCTENSTCGSGQCTGGMNDAADIVLGQPDLYRATCNGNNTERKPPDPGTLCLLPYPEQVSPLEGARGSTLDSDGHHNLYVVDAYNNRLLRYDDPFATDTEADEVWGQEDFSHQDCNRGNRRPSAGSLCTGARDRDYGNFFASAVAVSRDGQSVWVTDPGNHRVLRFHPGAPNASIVLGQTEMTEDADGCHDPDRLDRMCAPNGLVYDEAKDTLYVLEGRNDRDRRPQVLVFRNPEQNGQTADAVLRAPEATSFLWPRGIRLDPTAPDTIWLADTDHHRLLRFQDGQITHVVGQRNITDTGCDGMFWRSDFVSLCHVNGAPALDRDGSIYATDAANENVQRFLAPIRALDAIATEGAQTPHAQRFFISQEESGHQYINRVGPRGLANPGDVLPLENQLVVADRRRILVWDDYRNVSGPAGPAHHVLGQPSFFDRRSNPHNAGHDFTALAYAPQQRRLYAAHGSRLSYWALRKSGLRSQAAPDGYIEGPLPQADGGPALDVWFTGVAVDPRPDVLWVSDGPRHRVLRIVGIARRRPMVDLVLGQPDALSTACNAGRGPRQPGPRGFCDPRHLNLNSNGDLFVSDGAWEQREGNRRILRFCRQSIPEPHTGAGFALLEACQVIGVNGLESRECPDGTDQLCAPSFIAFHPSTGRALASGDAYYNPLRRRLAYWDRVDLAGRSAGPPTGFIDLPINQAGPVRFGADGQLIILDHTWNRVVVRPPLQPERP